MKLKSLLVFAGGFLTCAALAGAVMAGMFFLSVRFGGDEYLSEEIPVSRNGYFSVWVRRTNATPPYSREPNDEEKEYILEFLSNFGEGKEWTPPEELLIGGPGVTIYSSYKDKSVRIEFFGTSVRVYTYSWGQQVEPVMEYTLEGDPFDPGNQYYEIYNYLKKGFTW